MATRGTGLDSQWGIKIESVPGTYAAPDTFSEFESESVKPTIQQYTPLLLGRGDVARGANTRSWVKGGGGDLVLPVLTAGHGKYFKLITGAVATTGAADPYTHTFTKDTVGLKGLSATVQKGAPPISGAAADPHSFTGCKIVKAKFEFKVDEPLRATYTWDVSGHTTAQALASASYPSDAVPLMFIDGSATINGSAISIMSGTIEIDTGLKVDRWMIGNVKKEQLRNAEYAITGQLDYEYEGLTRHTDLINGTRLEALVLAFAVSGDSDNHGVTFTIGEMIYTDSDGPVIGGPDVVTESMPWKALDNGSDPFISIAYVTPDSTP